jgi:hypothetical protein
MTPNFSDKLIATLAIKKDLIIINYPKRNHRIACCLKPQSGQIDRYIRFDGLGLWFPRRGGASQRRLAASNPACGHPLGYRTLKRLEEWLRPKNSGGPGIKEKNFLEKISMALKFLN